MPDLSAGAAWTHAAARLKFDPHLYRERNSDLAALSDEDVTAHWFHHGRDEERSGARPSWRAPEFDHAFYLRHNPDVVGLVEAGDYCSAAEHWFVTGRDEVADGIRPKFGDFDEADYLAIRPDVAEAVAQGHHATAFDHWLGAGRREERESKAMPHRRLPRIEKAGVLSAEKQAFWNERGYVVLEAAITHDRCDAVSSRINELWTIRRDLSPEVSIDTYLDQPHSRRMRLRDAPGDARAVPYKINDLFLFDPLVRGLALDLKVCEVLRWVLKSDPTVIASLNFERGSTQEFHTDTLYMPGLEENSMTAGWFALEDVTAEAGPLNYYPGSHKIPLFRFSHGRSHRVDTEMGDYDQHMFGHVERWNLKHEQFLPKKGDVLIWNERLFHGGAPIKDMAQTRKSLVCHYWRADLMPRDQIVASGGGYYLDRPYF